MRPILYSALSLCLLSACAPLKIPPEPKYWQRTEAASQIYLRGPKAQHTLNHDIANCVAEIKELERLGSLREAIPPDTLSHNYRTDGAPTYSYVAGYDTPRYDGEDYAAYFDYADFEGCMREKGWQRVEHVPYDVADEARKNWLRTIMGLEENTRPRSSFPQDYPSNPDFKDLNN